MTPKKLLGMEYFYLRVLNAVKNYVKLVTNQSVQNTERNCAFRAYR